jgi:protein TonB
MGKAGVKVRTRLLIGLALLGILSSQPSAFSQETAQQTITRKIRTKVEPKYPELARQYHLSGKVRIEVIVLPDGTVTKTRIVGGSPLLVSAAIDAIKQWKYEPGPKETVETIDVAFQGATR